MGKRWLRDKKKDHYYKMAKATDYRSRASFKLKQLNKKFKIIKKGGHVLDLGAAPGGWMQVAGEIIGQDGFVLGVDLDPITPFKEENIGFIKGDFTTEEVREAITGKIGKANAVISDASPNITGAWDMDHFRSVDLCRTVLGIARDVLKPGGNLLMKQFQGEETKEFVDELKKSFEYCKITKPNASRDQSAEVYIIAKNFKGARLK